MMTMEFNIQKIRGKNYKEEALKEIVNDKTIALIVRKFNANVVRVSRRKIGLLKTYPFMNILNDRRKWFYFLEDCPQLKVKKKMLLPYNKEVEHRLVNDYRTSFLVVAFLKSKKDEENPDGKVVCKEVIFE